MRDGVQIQADAAKPLTFSHWSVGEEEGKGEKGSKNTFGKKEEDMLVHQGHRHMTFSQVTDSFTLFRNS